MKSLFYIIICTAALAFNSCLTLLLGEQIGGRVETNVACFTTNPNVKISAHHVCSGIRHILMKKQSDHSWLDIRVEGDSNAVFSMKRDNVHIVNSLGDTLYCSFRSNEVLKELECIRDTTVFPLFFAYQHTKEDVYVSVSIDDFPDPSDHTLLVFCVPMAKIDMGPIFKNSKK